MLYLIKRGPRPEYHRTPYHPVIICDRKPVAQWQQGWTGDGATVWEHDGRDGHTGWLITRWQGLIIDYGGMVKSGKLPDGAELGFYHRSRSITFVGGPLQEPWTLIAGAVFWSEKRMPAWLETLGAVYPADDFTQQTVLDDHVTTRAEAKRQSYVSGIARPIPAWWPGPGPAREALAQGAAMAGFVGAVDRTVQDAEARLVHTEVAGTHCFQALPEDGQDG